MKPKQQRAYKCMNVSLQHIKKKKTAINFDFVSFVFGRLHNVAVFRDFTHSSHNFSSKIYKIKT